MPEEDNIYNFFLMGVQMTSNNLDPSKPVYVDSIEKSVLGIMQPRRRTVVTVDAPNMIHKSSSVTKTPCSVICRRRSGQEH